MRHPMKLSQLLILVAATALGMKLSVAVARKPLEFGVMSGRVTQRFVLVRGNYGYLAYDTFEVVAPCLFCWRAALSVLSIRRDGGLGTAASPRPSVWSCWLIVLMFFSWILYDGIHHIGWINLYPSNSTVSTRA